MGIVGTHDVSLMTLSLIVAWFASYTALDVANRINNYKNYLRYIWLLLAGFCMGSGIWGMHFVAMSAYSSPYVITYDVELTVLSYVIAVLGTTLGFFIVTWNNRYRYIVLSGILMGISIATMHYIGVAAMQLPATVNYVWVYVGISVFIAIASATISMWLAFNSNTVQQKLTASLAMGFAISAMHYTAMEACTFQADVHVPKADAGLYQTNLALAVSVVVGILLLFSLIMSIFDRRFAFLAEKEAQVLVQSEKKYRDLYRETPLPIQLVDKAGVIVDVSNSWLQMLGYTRSEVLGQPFTKFLEDESIIAYETRLNTFLPSHLNEYRLIHKQGKKLDVLLSSTLRRDEHGAVIGVQEGLVDITLRKIAENSLRQKQKSEVLGELVGGISHDFNNLLMVISGSADLIKSKPETLNNRVDLIQETVKRGQYLTRRLLSFARKDSVAEPAFVDLKIFLSEFQPMLERSLGSNIKVHVDVQDDIHLIQVDINELQLTIVNLCLNSRDAIKNRGYISVRASNENLPNPTVPSLSGKFVKISVTDTGEGMTPEQLSRVFEPFYTTKDGDLGSGLGLSQVYGFAAVRYKGTVLVHSERGVGTTVDMYIPSVVVNYNSEAALTSVLREYDGQHRPVLVVEDDPQIQELIKALFESLNFNVLTAFDADEALKILETNQVFAVFTDVIMPGSMNGIQLANTIRERYKSIFIALITGYNDPSDDLIATTFPILKKPFTIRTLQQFISSTLKQ